MNEQVTQLYRSIELRDYELFKQLIGELIVNSGWLSVVKILKRGKTLRTDWSIPIRSGTLHDALVKLWRSEIIGNLDCDLLDAFGDKDFRNLEDLRLWVLTKSVNLLKEQIERGCTFFLDTQALSTSVHAVLVQDIIEVRRKEVENLPSKPSMREIYSTYYGYSILMAGDLKQWRAGASKETVDQVDQLISDFGGTAKLAAKMMKKSKRAFLNCSPETRELLFLLLKVSMAGYSSRQRAAIRLGEIGDSRAIPIILERLRASNSHYEKQSLIKALGKLGHTELLVEVESFLKERYLHSAAVEALSGIRHPKAVKILNEQGMSRQVIESLGRTHHPEALDVLSENFFLRHGRRQASALIALHSFGPEGDAIIKANPAKVALALKRGGNPVSVLKVLNDIPGYIYSTRIINAILESLRYRSHVRKVIRHLENMKEVIASPEFIDGFISQLEKNLPGNRRPYYRSYYNRRNWAYSSAPLIQKLISLIDEPKSLIRRLKRIDGIHDIPSIAAALEIPILYSPS
ncbi:MAG: hypothetical protein RTU30_15295 [Candidatus Thorarchaeota archaeon]